LVRVLESAGPGGSDESSEKKSQGLVRKPLEVWPYCILDQTYGLWASGPVDEHSLDQTYRGPEPLAYCELGLIQVACPHVIS
jgi:hypothetical protein